MDSTAVSFYNIQHFHEIEAVYTCCLYKKDLTNVSTFFGPHLDNKTNEDVRGIALSHCKIKCFPRELTKIFPNMDHIAINGGLKEISKDDLSGFKKLKFLDLQGCEIAELSGDLFENTPNLELIYLSHNRISKIGRKVLEPLMSLKYISFHGNDNIDAVYDVDKPSEFTLEEIKALIMVNCQAENGPGDNFKGITNAVRASGL